VAFVGSSKDPPKLLFPGRAGSWALKIGEQPLSFLGKEAPFGTFKIYIGTCCSWGGWSSTKVMHMGADQNLRL
jgi:hypothetical protein